MNKYNIFGIIISILYIYIIFGTKTEVGYNHNLQLTIKPFLINGHIYICNKHIHHWMISLIILIFIIPFRNNRYIDICIGFFIIFCIHGLCYKDRFIL